MSPTRCATLVLLLGLAAVALAQMPSTPLEGPATCQNYLTQCNMKNQASCCMYPIVLCLPDNKGSSSCLSPFDFRQLSPKITESAPYMYLISSLRNATMALYQATTIITSLG